MRIFQMLNITSSYQVRFNEWFIASIYNLPLIHRLLTCHFGVGFWVNEHGDLFRLDEVIRLISVGVECPWTMKQKLYFVEFCTFRLHERLVGVKTLLEKKIRDNLEELDEYLHDYKMFYIITRYDGLDFHQFGGLREVFIAIQHCHQFNRGGCPFRDCGTT